MGLKHVLSRVWVACILAVSPSVSSAGEVSILDKSVFEQSDHLLLETWRGEADVIEYVRSLGDKKGLSEAFGWNFSPPIQLDGALSYQEAHQRAFLGALAHSKVFLFSGDIERDDYKKLTAFLDANDFLDCLEPGICPFNNVLALDSGGMVFSEAVEIARYVAKHDVPVVVLAGGRCESACSLIFFSGYSNYNGYFYPRRAAHRTAKIGLHRPSITIGDFDYPAANVRSLVSYVIDIQNTVVRLYTEGSISLGALGNMYSTAPGEMYHLDFYDMQNEGITILGSSSPLTATPSEEQIRHICGRKLQILKPSYSAVSIDARTKADSKTFLYYGESANFICLGLKVDERWHVMSGICDSPKCEMKFMGQIAVPKYDARFDNIAVSFDNTEYGRAISENFEDPQLLDYLYESNVTFEPVEYMGPAYALSDTITDLWLEADGDRP